MKITVLGSGRWASFLAWYAASNGHDALLWGRPGSKSLEELTQNRANGYVTLPDSVKLTDGIDKALAFGDIALVAVGAQQLRSLLSGLPHKPRGPLVLCMKGLEEGTGLRLSQVAAQCLGQIPVAVWVGPGHPQDFIGGVPNCMVIDSEDPALTHELADSLSGSLIRFYYGEDLTGTEIGAAAKNVVGLAAGMLDGLGLTSLKGVLMARGAREISRLAAKMGGREITIYGICHLGDYQATLFSPYSHNRRCGECRITGEPYAELAEGVATARSLMKLSRDCGVDLPICAAVNDIFEHGREPKEALAGLFLRSAKSEFYL
ncbi:MAG: glycerol-3-phosphate dehydrogenase [Oscillospiraceae bacterium]|jgi:glycerol-3-phosphate dehydrogenase (NAD(P)+)|nr:glycerol-3-phosphate dehydrogenase [Oscillospiraceae bacterium]